MLMMCRRLKRRVLVGLFVCTFVVMVILILQRTNTKDTELPEQIDVGRRDYVRDNVKIVGSEFWSNGGDKTKLTNQQIKHRNRPQVFNPQSNTNHLKYEIVRLKTANRGYDMYVYSGDIDELVSSHVKQYGTWEKDLLEETADLLTKFQNTTFIDLGCNIGVYTMYMASLGVNIVAVDAVPDNLQLLSMSVSAAGFNDVTLVWNAISDEYKTVDVEIPEGNIGGAHVIDHESKSQTDVKHSVPTILLDDLLPLIKTGTVVIKMDIEGHELNALLGSKVLFQTADVKFVLMEFVHHRAKTSGALIRDFFIHNGFLPYEYPKSGDILNLKRLYDWPENVFWIKR